MVNILGTSGTRCYFPIAVEFTEYLLSTPVWETRCMTFCGSKIKLLKNVNHSGILICLYVFVCVSQLQTVLFVL